MVKIECGSKDLDDRRDKMLTDVKDEVLSGLPLYTIRDNNGNVLNDDVDISLKTPIIQEGTPINRALFRNLQGDLYTSDRYNLLSVTSEETKMVNINGFVLKSSIGNSINAVATDGNGTYVAVGSSGYIATSTDLINWTKQTSGTSYAFYDIAYGDGAFIAVGQYQCIYKSTNGGVTWTRKLNSGSSYTLYSIAYGNGGFVASGDAQNVLSENNSFYSIDGGETWVARDVGQKNYSAYTSFANNQFIITTGYNNGTIYTTSTADGSLTTKATGVTALDGYPAYDVIYANGYYVAGGYRTLAISKDLINWTQISTDRVNALIENEGQILMGLEKGYLKATEDFEYIRQSSSGYPPIKAFIKEGDKIIFFTYTNTGSVYKSTTFLSEYKQNLDIPLTSYEKGKIVNIEGGRIFEYKEAETVAENLFPASSDFTSNSATKYTSSDGFVLISSGGQNLLNSIDDSVSTDWQDSTSNLATQWVRMEVPNPNGYKITKMKLKAGWSGQSSQKIAIQGSFDGSTWTDLFVWSGAGVSVDEDNIELNNTDFYKYYRVSVVLNTGATQGKAIIYDWKVREYLRILSTDDQYVTSFYNPYLNINNLGEKQINGTINYGQRYSLVYNGESWDIGNAKAVTGSVAVAQSSTVNIELYGAKFVIADMVGATPQYYLGAKLFLPNNTTEYLYSGSKITTATLSTDGNTFSIQNGTTSAQTINYVAFY